MSMNDAISPSSSADRASLYRRRRAEGRHVARVEIGPEEIGALVEIGLLAAGDEGDRAAIKEALELLLFVLTQDAIDLDWSRWD